MQTFLPVANFRESLQTLDRQRLGKQRVEVKQIYLAIVTEGGYYTHAATQMWVGYTDALLHYGMEACNVWADRGYKDNLWLQFYGWLEGPYREEGFPMPPWFGSPKLHASHRSNLLRKNYKHYSQFGWAEHPNWPYFWPSANYDWRKHERV